MHAVRPVRGIGRSMRHHFFLTAAAGLWGASLAAQTPTGPAPTGLDVLVNSPSSIHVTWTRGTSVSAYMVARYRSSNMTTPERQSAWMTATTTSWDDPGLVGGTTYVYRLAARYANMTIGVADKTVALPVIADAPAPVLKGASQDFQSIWPGLCFDLPPNATGVSVQRQREGNSTVLTITPAPIAPSAIAGRCGPTTFLWLDNSLTTIGTYYYSVTADLSDGRKGTSAWVKYVPTLPDPTSVTVKKQDSYTALVTFGRPGASLGASGCKLFGTGLPAAGVDATTFDMNTGGTIVVPSLAAGTYTWSLRAVYRPGLMSPGVPVTITMP